MASHPTPLDCQQGFSFLNANSPSPNILTGAVVGGPDQNDAFSDARNNYAGTEPATYINVPLVGCLPYLVGSYGKDKKESKEEDHAVENVKIEPKEYDFIGNLSLDRDSAPFDTTHCPNLNNDVLADDIYLNFSAIPDVFKW
ncbi:Endoglucanase 17 [Platanthera guangdongensis]|uniref:cellulase n=1 Tax=Platanthera guangdongensis TaxID=2320717 RepID=A0ABR2M2X3_9ASPA